MTTTLSGDVSNPLHLSKLLIWGRPDKLAAATLYLIDEVEVVSPAMADTLSQVVLDDQLPEQER